MLIAIIPVLVCLLGLITYAISANPKVSELGRLSFACGLLVVCLVAARYTLHLP
jgi:hypothetical protein